METLARPALIQTEEISRLTREAEELEGRAARLRVAVENCRRSISPQSPDCFIEISWLRTRVSWKEAERIAQGMEEKARDLRRRIEILKARASQAATPPPPVTQKPQNTTSPPPVSNAPSGQQKPAPNAPAQTAKPPAPAQTAAPSTPAAPRRIAGLTESEWEDYKFLQREVEELYSRVPLDNEESIRLFEALKARNALWEKAVSRSGLRAEERKKLRLPIPEKPVSEAIPKWQVKNPGGKLSFREPPPPTPFPANYSTLVAGAYMETGAQQAVDEFGKVATETINYTGVDRGVLTAENLVGVSKITMKLKQKDIPGAISETVDFIAAKVVAPIASMNASVFKSVYSKVSFAALENFFKETDRAMQELTGGKVEFNYEEFDRDMNTGKKTVSEWIGWGDLMKDKIKEERKNKD
ncbi:MAG: hypothetical protein H5U05_09030 [Candidatus Aminicenantes bacterium]|nr:hypothetical protein [Candidatus Aminicenantes bacterium]